MGWDLSVASMGMELNAMKFQQNYAVAVQDMAMDTMKLAESELADLVSAAPAAQPPKGEFIDIYV